MCRREYESQDRKVNERPVEFHFVFDQLSKSSVRSVLDRYDGAAQRSTKLWVRRHGDGQCAGLSAERHLQPALSRLGRRHQGSGAKRNIRRDHVYQRSGAHCGSPRRRPVYVPPPTSCRSRTQCSVICPTSVRFFRGGKSRNGRRPTGCASPRRNTGAVIPAISGLAETTSRHRGGSTWTKNTICCVSPCKSLNPV